MIEAHARKKIDVLSGAVAEEPHKVTWSTHVDLNKTLFLLPWSGSNSRFSSELVSNSNAVFLDLFG